MYEGEKNKDKNGANGGSNPGSYKVPTKPLPPHSYLPPPVKVNDNHIPPLIWTLSSEYVPTETPSANSTPAVSPVKNTDPTQDWDSAVGDKENQGEKTIACCAGFFRKWRK